MNFYDVLAAKNWGGGIPTTNFFDLLFAQSMGGGEQWQTYEGTLPATINANGDDMRQYQGYGAAGGVGDRTVQLFDKNATDTDNGYVSGGYLATDGEITNNGNWSISEYIDIEQNKNYALDKLSGNAAYCLYDGTKNYISGARYNNESTITFNSGNAKYIRLSVVTKPTLPVYNLDILTLTEGTTPPETYVPFGYEVDMGVKSGNLWNEDYSGISNIIKYKPLFVGSGDFTLSTTAPLVDGQSALLFLLSGQVSSGASGYNSAYNGHSRTQTAIDGYITIAYRIFGYNPTAYKTMLNAGSTPLPYQPYSNTTTPIYIGDDPLGEDEYVDYQAQKIYRMIDGTLTPTDPPVPLPALPTCEGKTVVDYAGQSVAPEKVVFKYKKGGN